MSAPPCPTCEGSGHVWASRRRQAAPGERKAATVPCAACLGTGRVTARGGGAAGRRALAESTFGDLVAGRVALADLDPRLAAIVRAWVDEDPDRATAVALAERPPDAGDVRPNGHEHELHTSGRTATGNQAAHGRTAAPLPSPESPTAPPRRS